MSKDYLQTSMFCDWNIWSQRRSHLSQRAFKMIITFKLSNCIVKPIFWQSWENVCQGLFLSICWRERWTSIIPLSLSAKWLLKDHPGPLNLELPISLERLNGVGIKINVAVGKRNTNQSETRSSHYYGGIFSLIGAGFCQRLPFRFIQIYGSSNSDSVGFTQSEWTESKQSNYMMLSSAANN